jgi:hypothetical protein
LSVSVFEKTEVSCAFPGAESTNEPSGDAKQLIFKDF